MELTEDNGEFNTPALNWNKAESKGTFSICCINYRYKATLEANSESHWYQWPKGSLPPGNKPEGMPNCMWEIHISPS